jgi:hypothetical protein
MWEAKLRGGGDGERGGGDGREEKPVLLAVAVAIPYYVALIVDPHGYGVGPCRPQQGAEVRRLP